MTMSTTETTMNSDCVLCRHPRDTSSVSLWQDDFCRIVRVDDPDYPGYCRVIVHAHIREMSDLLPAQQLRLLQVLMATERALRQLMQPDKINLASFGNVVPHLHWHIIPRWQEDVHFPLPIWGERQRQSKGAAVNRDCPDDATLAEAIQAQLMA